MHVFFFEIPRIEELQDPSSSPRREEVGRRTPRVYGGFLLPFFYRARFQLLTSRFSQASKTTTTSLQTLWEHWNRLLLEEYYIFNVAIPPEDDFLKKNMHVEQVVNRGIQLLLLTKNKSPKKVHINR